MAKYQDVTGSNPAVCSAYFLLFSFFLLISHLCVIKQVPVRGSTQLIFNTRCLAAQLGANQAKLARNLPKTKHCFHECTYYYFWIIIKTWFLLWRILFLLKQLKTFPVTFRCLKFSCFSLLQRIKEVSESSVAPKSWKEAKFNLGILKTLC